MYTHIHAYIRSIFDIYMHTRMYVQLTPIWYVYMYTQLFLWCKKMTRPYRITT